MNTRSTISPSRRAVATVVMILGASVAFAADPPAATPPAPSKEMREKMATVHEQMAACLRSDKPLADCRSQMMKSCKDTLGKHDCPMMGHGMMGSAHGKHPKDMKE